MGAGTSKTSAKNKSVCGGDDEGPKNQVYNELPIEYTGRTDRDGGVWKLFGEGDKIWVNEGCMTAQKGQPIWPGEVPFGPEPQKTATDMHEAQGEAKQEHSKDAAEALKKYKHSEPIISTVEQVWPEGESAAKDLEEHNKELLKRGAMVPTRLGGSRKKKRTNKKKKKKSLYKSKKNKSKTKKKSNKRLKKSRNRNRNRK